MTVSDLIPEEMQARLLQVRGQADKEFWTIGDVSAELVDEAAGDDKRFAIRSAVAAIAGVKAATVRDYEACAKFYPAEMRGDYPTLTRYHFRHAKKSGDLLGARGWLDKASQSADEYGGLPMPVDVLAAKMTGHTTKEKPEEYALPVQGPDRLIVLGDRLPGARTVKVRRA